MKIFNQARQSGKTTKLIEMAHADKLIVVCPSYQIAMYVKQMAEDMEKPVEVMTWDMWVNKKYYGRKDFNGFVIDELLLCLQYQSNVPIKAVTFTEGEV